jgi:glycerophosphoryl diester phosphodiesterase
MPPATRGFSTGPTAFGTNNPFLAGQPATHPNSRGFEGMAMSPNTRYLYAALEGPKVADFDQTRRFIYEFSVKEKAFTGNLAVQDRERCLHDSGCE